MMPPVIEAYLIAAGIWCAAGALLTLIENNPRRYGERRFFATVTVVGPAWPLVIVGAVMWLAIEVVWTATHAEPSDNPITRRVKEWWRG